jgi:hypothetical protein
MIATWVPVMVSSWFEGQRLTSYLLDNHPATWSRLTHVPWLGPGGQNSFRFLPWLYSRDDLGDPVVASLKQEHRDFLRWWLTVFVSYLVVLPVLLW